MSEPLTSEINRLKVTDDTMLWLRWKARITGKSHPELARDALHKLATQEMNAAKHKFSVLAALERGEGRASDTIATKGNPHLTPDMDD